MEYKADEKKFKDLEYTWPAIYPFKFILPSGEEKAIEDIFSMEVDIKKKPSSGGKYTSITIYAEMANANEILKLYKAASSISGIISL